MQPMLAHGVWGCVAVPVVVEGSLWGSLAAASRSGPLPAETEDRLTLLAELVAVAVVSAAAKTSIRVLADEQAALLRVAALVAQGSAEGAIFNAVALEAASLVDDEPTTLVRYEGKRTFTVLATRNGPVGPGTRVMVPLGDAGVLDEMLRTRKQARRDSYDVIAERSFSSRDYAVGSSVSVPIMVQGRLWGALGVLNEGRRLPAETEGRLAKFSELIGSALANVQARAELERFGEEQAALRRVAELAASGEPYGSVLRAVVAEASLLFDEAVVSVGRFGPSGTWRRVEGAGALSDLTVRTSPREDAVAQEVLATGRPVRIEEADAGVDGGSEEGSHLWGSGVPVRVEGETWGALVVIGGQRPLPAGTDDRMTHFAHVVATAVTNAENKAKLRASRARLVVTADETRQRLQRDVHDGAQQRLVQTVLTLKLALDTAARGEDPVELMREALQNAERATVELRDLVHGILPASLSRGGLRTGVESLIAGLPAPVELDVAGLPEQRLPTELEVTAYFVIAEALTNVVKHAGATRARVTLAASADVLSIEVVDDGRGGADLRGSGLTGLADRVDAMNGTLVVASPPGRGTTVRVSLPRPSGTG